MRGCFARTVLCISKMGELAFLCKQNAEMGGSCFLGWGIFGTEQGNVGCWSTWLRAGFYSRAAVAEAALGAQERACRGQRRKRTAAPLPLLPVSAHTHVCRHTCTRCTETAHGKNFFSSLMSYNPRLTCALAESTSFKNVLLSAVICNGRGRDWKRTCLLALCLSLFLCYQRFT